MPLSLPDGSSILHERAREFTAVSPAGALSVKTMRGGRAMYEVGDARYAVDAESYLILNHGRPYTVRIRSAAPMESFCIFFGAGLVEEVLRSVASPTEWLLDEPAAPRLEPVGFIERLYSHDALLTPAVASLRAAVASGATDSEWLGERVRAVAERLLEVHRGVRRDIARLPAARASTRAELYRRLYRARDWLDASSGEPVTLGEAAAVACLSPHHFLRSFKSLFGETPHRFLTRRRIARARALLATTDLSVSRICLELGFESLGSFSWLFRRHVGVSPAEFRKSNSEEAELSAISYQLSVISS